MTVAENPLKLKKTTTQTYNGKNVWSLLLERVSEAKMQKQHTTVSLGFPLCMYTIQGPPSITDLTGVLFLKHYKL